jgi:PEP-CTERM motif
MPNTLFRSMCVVAPVLCLLTGVARATTDVSPNNPSGAIEFSPGINQTLNFVLGNTIVPSPPSTFINGTNMYYFSLTNDAIFSASVSVTGNPITMTFDKTSGGQFTLTLCDNNGSGASNTCVFNGPPVNAQNPGYKNLETSNLSNPPGLPQMGLLGAIDLPANQPGWLYEICVDGVIHGSATTTYSAPFTLTGAPEPSTWAMMALGFAGLGFMGMRARKRSSVSVAKA